MTHIDTHDRIAELQAERDQAMAHAEALADERDKLREALATTEAENPVRIAGHIHAAHPDLFVDGRRFPWEIAQCGPRATYGDRDDEMVTTVWLPLLAASVTFDRTPRPGGGAA